MSKSTFDLIKIREKQNFVLWHDNKKLADFE